MSPASTIAYFLAVYWFFWPLAFLPLTFVPLAFLHVAVVAVVAVVNFAFLPVG
jgi:hypothetical protein